eukprot:Skav230717  [mRNA]  locus=scaffold715:233274:245062:- [translate_table: standard]
MLVAVWRWGLDWDRLKHSISTLDSEGSRSELLSHRSRISVLRNWAFKQGFNGIIDLPFVLLGLTSMIMPPRIKALLSILVYRENMDGDCMVRTTLLALPFLSLCDLLLLIFGLLALCNPLRCGRFLRQMSAKWNAPLAPWDKQGAQDGRQDRERASVEPNITQTRDRTTPHRSEDGEQLELDKIHQIALKQAALLLCDLLTLPSLLAVILTFYRYPSIQRDRQRLEKSWGLVAYHAAVWRNFLVLVHDLVLVLCALPLLLTVYRLPKVELSGSSQRSTHDFGQLPSSHKLIGLRRKL